MNPSFGWCIKSLLDKPHVRDHSPSGVWKATPGRSALSTDEDYSESAFKNHPEEFFSSTHQNLGQLSSLSLHPLSGKVANMPIHLFRGCFWTSEHKKAFW